MSKQMVYYNFPGVKVPKDKVSSATERAQYKLGSLGIVGPATSITVSGIVLLVSCHSFVSAHCLSAATCL